MTTKNPARVQYGVVRRYLSALHGEPVSENLTRLERVQKALIDVSDPLERLELVQRRINLSRPTMTPELESSFIQHAHGYSLRHGISRLAWRTIGVPERVLNAAGIKDKRHADQAKEIGVWLKNTLTKEHTNG